MKLFISWSGERSKALAQGLRNWFPGIINAVDPWISTDDIEPGAQWLMELTRQLESTKYGIVCLTADNLNSQWLLFEAGALSKHVDQARVVPIIIDDIRPADIQGPLSNFQSVSATESGIKKLIFGVNDAVFKEKERGMEKALLEEAYQLWWTKLEAVIDNLPSATINSKKTKRQDSEMIEEVLTIVRKLENKSSTSDARTVSTNYQSIERTLLHLKDKISHLPDSKDAVEIAAQLDHLSRQARELAASEENLSNQLQVVSKNLEDLLYYEKLDDLIKNAPVAEEYDEDDG